MSETSLEAALQEFRRRLFESTEAATFDAILPHAIRAYLLDYAPVRTLLRAMAAELDPPA